MMKKRIHTITRGIFAVGLLWISGTVWADGLTPAQIENLCKNAKEVSVPKQDVPPPGFKSDDDSINYYDPAVGKADYRLARWSAFREWQANKNDVLSGAYVLAMIYGNGDGVQKNVPLAIRFMCDTPSSVLEVLPNQDIHQIKLEKMDLYWGAASGLNSLMVAGHEDDNRTKRRELEWKKMAVAFSPQQEAAFNKLTTAATEWIEEKVSVEWSSGAADLWDHFWRLTEATPEEWKSFHTLLEEVRHDHVPSVTAEHPQALAKPLEQCIAQAGALLRAGLAYPVSFKYTQPDELQEAQRYWQRYRSAWRQFYVSLYPERSGQKLDDYLVKKRIEDWEDFVGSIGAGPSFSCARAHTKSELAICKSQELSALDRKLSAAYQEKMGGLKQQDQKREDLKRQQRDWQKKLTSCDGRHACLLDLYKTRIDDLDPGPDV